MTPPREPAILVSEYFPPTVGGAPLWLGAFVRASRRYKWTILTRPVAGAPPEEPYPTPAGPHHISRLYWWDVPRSWGGLATLDRLVQLRREIRARLAATGAKRIDAMPLHFSGIAAAGPARAAGAKLRLHLFGEELSMLARRTTRRWLIHQALREADESIAISPATREIAISLGASPEKVRLAIGIDTGPFADLPPVAEAKARWGAVGRRVLLTVARLAERKGHAAVLDAMARLGPSPELLYLIAGEGEERTRLEETVRARSLSAHVRFLGLIAEEDLPCLYRAADLFVHPHREIEGTGEIEGFGLVFLEAALAGVPAIAGRSGATARGGPGAAVVEGETALLVDPADPAALAEAIRGLLDDKAKRRAMGEAARARTLAEFDVARVVARLEEEGS